MIISFSEVYKWDSCQRQYYYNFTLGLQPLEVSDPINTGVKGHRLLQSFYEAYRTGITKEEARQRTSESATALIGKASIADVKALLKSWSLVDNYIRDTDFKSEAVLVENRFLFPASKLTDDPELADVQIGFTPDVVFERKSGFVDVEDAKFVGKAWSKSKLNRFPQAKLYQIFLKRMGYNVSRTTVRFFNTTTNQITAQHYFLGVDEEQSLIHDFIAGIKEVYRFRIQTDEQKELARRTMNYTTCQFCRYEEPCTLQAEGQDATRVFKYQYVKSDYDYST
jgi:hypothetical protein